jgi:16S rRNA (uracil1498-N3)-methyltransferase
MRRVRVQHVIPGELSLDADEAHHIRDVLRMSEGDAVEVFDAGGRIGQGRIGKSDARSVMVVVDEVHDPIGRRLRWTVASAVPKGSRVDWMIEKLSELGTDRFVPLATQRSVVHPEGKGKRERWMRIAAEAAKQSRRTGVMQIDELTDLAAFVRGMNGPGWYFSTEEQAVLATEAPCDGEPLNLLIGPEGGWTDEEMRQLREAGLTAVSLGATILRVETAAVAAAAIVAAAVAPRAGKSSH